MEWRPAEPFGAGASGIEHAAGPFGLSFLGDSLVLVRDSLPPAAPDTAGACAGSLRHARSSNDRWFAVWWLPAERGRVALATARSRDGGRIWSPPAIADGRDAGTDGCARPAPAIAADAEGAYAHFAYWMAPTDGAGVFYTHWMEHDGLFHAPVAVVYGDRVVAADVAASGERVLIAYEDPNAEGGLGYALSRTAGHVFEHHARLVPAHSRASRPLAALAGNRAAIAWHEAGADGTHARRLVRRATLAPPP